MVTLQVCTRFLARVEKISGEAWDFEQLHSYVETGTRWTRMGIANSGRVEEPTYEQVDSLFEDHTQWAALPPSACTYHYTSLAFIILSSTVCPFELMIWKDFRGFPYRVWHLLRCPTRVAVLELLRARACIKDRWTKAFLVHFNTVELLLKDGITL